MTSPPEPEPQPAPPLRQFTRSQINEGSGELDDRAILIIHNVVYDVTPFLDDHPGGHEVLTRASYQDASEDFDDIGHSSDAKQLMKKYVIGELVKADRVDVAQREFEWDDVKNSGGEGPRWWLPLMAAVVASLVWLYFV